MRAVITVIGKDMVGILAKISTECCNHNINVLEVTQSILQDMFAMIMMVDISKSDIPFTEFSDMLGKIGHTGHGVKVDMYASLHGIRHKITSVKIIPSQGQKCNTKSSPPVDLERYLYKKPRPFGRGLIV